MNSITRFLSATALVASTAAHAAPTNALNAKFGVCFSCHGAQGKAVIPMYPNLAGQNRQYLAQTLHRFRDGTRPDPVMGPMAKPLSDSDIDQIALYFSELR